MTTLLCFGLGYSAEHYLAMFGDGYDRNVGTARSAERAALLNAQLAGRLKVLLFDGCFAAPELTHAIAEADRVLVSVPPTDQGDPVLDTFGEALAQARHLGSIVYLSTVGVYGDCAGDWVNEKTPADPGSGRSLARLSAERAWQELGSRRGIAVVILRLAGIYGPGRNAIVQIANGSARRVVKAGQVFNRVHVDDIAQAIEAAFAKAASGVFNVADDEPSPAGDPLSFAAQLMGVTPPPEVAYEQAVLSMSNMAMSFWQECRRVNNDKLKRELGVSLLFPTYRDGLRALWHKQRQQA
jgi:nucleoside-diphosphate-sugar epimerase